MSASNVSGRPVWKGSQEVKVINQQVKIEKSHLHQRNIVKGVSKPEKAVEGVHDIREYSTQH